MCNAHQSRLAADYSNDNTGGWGGAIERKKESKNSLSPARQARRSRARALAFPVRPRFPSAAATSEASEGEREGGGGGRQKAAAPARGTVALPRSERSRPLCVQLRLRAPDPDSCQSWTQFLGL
jgi:hypothetical protein